MPQFTEWFRDRGDDTHRLNYDLHPSSNVVDLGGYCGTWSYKICRNYGCNVFLFEPIPEMMRKCAAMLQVFPKVTFYQYAVGATTSKAWITLDADSSSICAGKSDKPTIEIDVLSVEDFLGIIPPAIDLIKINVEGAEYPILESLLRLGETRRFKDIQVQFHTNYERAVERRNAIREGLARTHHLTYDYEFVWENWRINA